MDAILNIFIMARTGMMERLLGARKKFNDLVLAVMLHYRTNGGCPRSGEPTETQDLMIMDLPHDITMAGCPRIGEPTKTRELMIMLVDLPHDILLNILTKLPSSSLCCIRGVSMTLLNIIDNPSFATLYTSRLLNSAASYAAVVGVPQLMLLSNYYTWFLQDSKTYRLITLQSLKYDVDKKRLTRSGLCNARFCSSSRWYGYDVEFVFCNLIFIGLRGPRPYQCYLVNPLRGECLELPIIHDNVLGDRKNWFGMGFDTMTTSHKIVCISQSAINRGILIAYVYTLEGARSSSPTSWRQIQSVPPYKLSTDNVSAYGHMYWGAHDHGEYRIVSFDFKKEEFFLTPAPKLAHRYLHGACLLNFKGCLALVSSHSFTVKLWVLKDHENDEWELVYQVPSNLFSGIPRFQRLIVICGEWEHGLFFKETGSLIFHFWDARDNSMIYMETLFLSNSNSNRQLWTEDGGPLRISFFSYTHSPISLKNYGNLCEREVLKSAFCDRNSETSTWYFE